MFLLVGLFILCFFLCWFIIYQQFLIHYVFCFFNVLFLLYFLLLVHSIFYIMLFYQVNVQCFLSIFMDIGLLRVYWFCALDIISCILLYVVVVIAFFVNVYSIDYMGCDPHFPRYVGFLALFCLFMVFLITAVDFIQFFIGWEGVGLCSYLLISFWSTRLQASKAAIKAMLTNRLGDFGLMVSFVCLFGINKSLCFSIIFLGNCIVKFFFFNFLNFIDINILSICCFFLFMGAVGKSAQVGLHVWLPDAMEGPTPVSALIHAATMVTAGIFLLIRCSALFELCPCVLFFVTVVGALTAFFAGSVGVVQNDLKRIIAFSTCSQLGYMICSCGLSGYFIGFFHLFNHAFFKALLFLCAGCIIHILNDEQDLRKMGGLLYLLPFTYIIFFIGSLALLGFPYLSGFYSKDVLLEFAFSRYSFSGFFVFWLGSIAAFFTAFYSFRLLLLTFYVKVNMCYFFFNGIFEISFFLGLPLFGLCLCSIFFGFIFKDLFCGLGVDMLYSSIYVLYCNSLLVDFEFIPLFFKILPLIFSGCGIFFVFMLYFFFYKNIYFFFNCNLYVYYCYFFLNRKWFFDKIYNEFINQYFFIFSYFFFFCKIDRGILEYIGSYKIFFNIFNWSYFFFFFYSYFFFDFLILFFIFIFFFICFYLFFFICFYVFVILFIFSFFFFLLNGISVM